MGDKVRRLIAYHEDQIRKNSPNQRRDTAPPSNAQQQVVAQQKLQEEHGKLKRDDFWGTLERKLAETGRVNPTSKESVAKREAWSGEILEGMEKATRERQETQGATSLAHGVYGHGVGTDQVSRLVHGRRNDELREDRDKGTAPSTSVRLTGNPNLEDRDVGAYTTVGSDPNNTSGAFTSNIGMLHVVESAFSQAAILSSDQQRRRESGEEATLDKERFVPTVSGPGGGIGYTVSVNGAPRQEKGEPVTPDEMKDRFQKIQVTDGMQNATLVLDPTYIGTGPDAKRAGWQLQTAFPNNETLTPRLDAPQDVDRMLALRAAAAQVEAATVRLKDAENALVLNQTKIDNLTNKVIEGIKTGLKKAKEQNKSTTALEERLAAKEQELEVLKTERKGLEGARDTAKRELQAAEQELERLKKT